MQQDLATQELIRMKLIKEKGVKKNLSVIIQALIKLKH